MTKLLKFLDSLALPQRFLVVMGGIIVMTAFSAQLFYSRQSRNDLEMRLREKATFINSFYSFLIADALTRNDDITLLQVVNRLEEDQEISSVVVVDKHNEIRYHIDPEKIGMVYDDPMVKSVLQSGDALVSDYHNAGGKALALVSPLKVQGLPQPAGVVRIDMTYRRISEQVSTARWRFFLIMLGSVVSCVGFVFSAVGRWVLMPLDRIRGAVAAINPAMPEPNLPETPDEFGKVNAAINDLVLRFRNEGQQQYSNQQSRGEQERVWVQQLARSFFPGARLIVADKDNRIISDSGNGSRPPAGRPHLMDLITDTNFANLLNSAFQKEGEAVRGSVTFQDKSYGASILSVPLQQSVIVKTLIALQPN